MYLLQNASDRIIGIWISCQNQIFLQKKVEFDFLAKKLNLLVTLQHLLQQGHY